MTETLSMIFLSSESVNSNVSDTTRGITHYVFIESLMAIKCTLEPRASQRRHDDDASECTTPPIDLTGGRGYGLR